ncbi:hypothetical protein CesoFtcFv8_015591 [Champsocephalus esox]|uniref:Dynein heavy chain tail domain-containing protein n=1 Tax=Champsocephalus esox TaxID=159716 RepID=A0AAN8GVJ5_9TELE|nr:hypothetical protein CesoFtcFv8_015591 [Champsocephalus esox]
MEGSRDERIEVILRLTLSSLGLQMEVWRDFLSEEENQVTLSSFFSIADYSNLFLCRDPGLCISLTFPSQTSSKVLVLSRSSRAVISAENIRDMLIMQEVQGGGAVSCISAVCQEVTCPLLSNPDPSGSWAAGVAEEALRFMERQKNEALVMEAQIRGRTFLPQPHALHDNRLHGDVDHDGDLHDDVDERKLSDLKLLHACDWTIIEWAELVSEFLQQDSSQAVLDGLKPLPCEEFNFWRNRLKNLLHIQQQLSSSRAQQVASIVQQADSVYLSTLRDIHTDLQQGLREAQDVTENLERVQQKLEELQLMEFQQLEANMAAVMEEVQLLWVRSESYCKPCRVVVLLQEVCNLFIQRSRDFLQGGGELLKGLLSGPDEVLQGVSLVVRTLQTFRETFMLSKGRLQDMKQEGAAQSWDFPTHLVFLHLDDFLLHLQNIQEVFRVSLQLRQLEEAVVSGTGGRKWTEEVQEVYQDFLLHVTSLSECSCDPTDPENQGFRLLLDQFQLQVEQVEQRLVSVLCRALQDSSEPASSAKLLQMFSFVLPRPVILEQLRPHLLQLLQGFLLELDSIEQLFHTQRETAHTFSCYTPPPAAALCWSRQLRLRAEHTLHLYTSLTHLYRSAEGEQVEQRVQQVLVLLQDFRARRLSDWIRDLDSDCGDVMQQPLIQQLQQGMLGVPCSHKLEAVLRELRCVSRDPDVELRPLAAHLFSCKDDITQSYLSLGHMVSCYNQVLQDGLQVERPLIQDQLQDLDRDLAELQSRTWGSTGVHQLVQQLSQRILKFHSTVSEARANMDAMTRIIQGWAELHLLHSGDFLPEGGASGRSHRRITEEGQELLRLTQVNCSLYAAGHAPPAWSSYLEHIDHRVQDALLNMMHTALTFLCDSMSPTSCSVFLTVSLQLQEAGSVFEPSVGGGLSDLLQSFINGVYSAASLPPRISASHRGNYQQEPRLSALEQEVMRRLQKVKEEAELLQVKMDRYSHLWQSDRQAVMQEFLTYSRQLGPEELEAPEAPPTLKDFQRELQALSSLQVELSHLDEQRLLGWLKVELHPFRDSLLSIIQEWSDMYTQHLLSSVSTSLQQVTQHTDEDSSSSSEFPVTETLLLLEATGVQLPEHLSAQLQV